MKFALTGISIAHSKSPQLFAAAYPHTSDSYILMPARSAEEAVQLFRTNGLHGMNVTMPFKKDIVPFTDVQSDEVKAIGAANTIVNRDGKLYAYNTDVNGVADSFIRRNIVLENKKALVLGAGGAGQAAAYALSKAGAEVLWANRTKTKLMESFGELWRVENGERRTESGDKRTVAIASLSTLHSPLSTLHSPLSKTLHSQFSILNSQFSIIVNTLPAEADFLRTLRFHKHQVVLDADYANSPLYRQATSDGAEYISGYSWLLWQAVPAFELFTGAPPDVEAMRLILNDE
jgi:shikimate dehydrogenase